MILSLSFLLILTCQLATLLFHISHYTVSVSLNFQKNHEYFGPLMQMANLIFTAATGNNALNNEKKH